MARTIYLYGEVGWDFSDKLFAEQLQEVPAGERVTVAINSVGGDVFQGQAIHALMKNRGAVDVRIDGLAASAASFLAMAGETVMISSGGMLMVHSPLALAYGNAKEMRELADVLDKVEASVMIPAYASKTGKKPEELKALLDAETWLSADEAKELGFVDGFSDQPAVLDRVPVKFSAVYRKIPDSLRPEKAQEGTPLASSRVPAVQKAGESKGDAGAKEGQGEATLVDYSVYQARLRLLGVVIGFNE